MTIPIKIISGIGIREYFYKRGYKLDSDGIYMEKKLNSFKYPLVLF